MQRAPCSQKFGKKNPGAKPKCGPQQIAAVYRLKEEMRRIAYLYQMSKI